MVHKLILLIFLLSPFSFLISGVSAQEASWPMAGANPQRTSWVSEEVKGQLKPLWYKHFEPFINPKFQIIADAGTLYITTSHGIYAVDANTGNDLWVHPFNFPPGNSPTLFAGNLYIGGLDRQIHVIDAHPETSQLPTDSETGQKINNQIPFNFDFTAEKGFETNPLIVNNTLYAGNRDGFMYALDLNTRKLKWKFATNGPILLSAAVSPDNRFLYFASNDSFVYALDSTSGALFWKSAKLPGAGFYSWWPVYYTDSQNKAWIVFTGSHNYRTIIEPGEVSQFLPIEGTDVFPQRGESEADGVLLGKLGTAAGPWVTGTPTLDTSQSEASPVGNTIPITEYLESKPWRRTVFVFDALTGQEYTSDFDADGKPEYAPFLWVGTHSGPRYPAIVGSGNLLYLANDYISDPYINGSNITGWFPGSPDISLNTGIWLAVDEPYSYSAGGNMIYWNHTLLRSASGIDTTIPDTELLTTYQSGLRPPNDDHTRWQRQWLYYLYNLENQIPDVFSRYQTNLTYGGHLFNGSNGVYSAHGNQTAPLPYQGKVFIQGMNVLIAFTSGNPQLVHRPLAKTVSTDVAVAPSPAKERLRQSLISEVQKIISAGHLRPGHYPTGMFEYGASRWCGSESLPDYFHYPGETLYYLIRALPHLPTDLQIQTKTYIQQEYTAYSPLTYNHIGWRDGAARENFDFPPEVETDRQYYPPQEGNWGYPQPGEIPWFYSPLQFYHLWKYAQVFGGGKQIFDAVKTKLESPRPDSEYLEYPHALNAFIAGYLGYLELEKMAGYPENISKRDIYNRLLNLRVSSFSQNVPTALSQSQDFGKFQCLALNSSRNFIYLVPEVANYLGNQIPDKIQVALQTYNFNTPYWFISKFDVSTSESVLHNLYDPHALFQAKALILQEPYEELVKYLDVPAFERGDLFYIDNLVAALEAPYVGESPTPSPRISGDANDDGFVDGIDYVIWLNHYSQSVTGPVNGDFDSNNIVDGVDYVIWLNHYGS